MFWQLVEDEFFDVLEDLVWDMEFELDLDGQWKLVDLEEIFDEVQVRQG